MDSGNSGSMQSSSGGDEDEYDSRSDSISAFFHSSSSSTAALTNLPPPPPPPQQPPPLFDSLSYLDSSPNPLLNLDALWSRTLLRPPSSSSTNPNNFTDVNVGPPFIPTTSSAPPPLGPQQQQGQAPSVATRGSKKRSRASRRAPTTVLTTDTSNFRAMVQEFTGIPTAPAGFSRPRFNPPSSYYNLPRPFPQRIFTTTTTTNAMNTSISANLVQQNPIPNFESLLPPKPTLPIMPPFSARSQAPVGSHANYNDDLRWAEGFAIRDQSQMSRPLSAAGFPTSVFQGEKVSVGAAARREGTLDTNWSINAKDGQEEEGDQAYVCFHH